MATTPGPSSPDAGQAEKVAIMQWMRDVSLEATRPTADEIDKLAGLLPAGARLYLTAAPGRALDELERSAALARARGLTPVPHLSARHFISFDQVDNHLRALAAGSAAGELMLVGGDIARPKGEVADVLSLIESGLLEKHGVRRVGLAGFPDGHPHMREEELEANLLTKLAALQQRGVEGEIVTQFCFDSGPILRWLEWLRARGVHAPVRVGLAGPTSLLSWLNYARRCGVKASAEALASRSGLIKQAFKPVAPDPIIRTLARELSAQGLANVRPHLFAFGGIEQTARWALAPMRGEIRLTRDGGFDPQ